MNANFMRYCYANILRLNRISKIFNFQFSSITRNILLSMNFLKFKVLILVSLMARKMGHTRMLTII